MADRTPKMAARTKKPQTAPTGNLFILSAPSGCGKTTLCKKILQAFADIRYSISHTTRSPRPNETDGKDYFFTSVEAFLQGIQDGSWAEWARVHDNYYGTSIEFLDNNLYAGRDVLLDIDVQGAAQILKQYPQAVSIFIMPPSIQALEDRLKSRGTDSEETIQKRLRNAIEEMQHRDQYKHVVVNDQLEEAVRHLLELIRSYRDDN